MIVQASSYQTAKANIEAAFSGEDVDGIRDSIEELYLDDNGVWPDELESWQLMSWFFKNYYFDSVSCKWYSKSAYVVH